MISFKPTTTESGQKHKDKTYSIQFETQWHNASHNRQTQSNIQNWNYPIKQLLASDIVILGRQYNDFIQTNNNWIRPKTQRHNIFNSVWNYNYPIKDIMQAKTDQSKATKKCCLLYWVERDKLLVHRSCSLPEQITRLNPCSL